MKFNNFAYIFLGPNLDPQLHKSVIKSENFTFTTIGIDFNNKELVIEIAQDLIKEGAQMIELCGGFGPIWIAKIYEATNNKIPIGGVSYGPEARKSLLDLLS